MDVNWKSKFAIVGLGIWGMGRTPGVTPMKFYANAIQEAIDDAGLTKQDVDGYVFQCGVGTQHGFGAEGGLAAQYLGLAVKMTWQLEAGGPTCIHSIGAACAALDAGVCNYVVSAHGSASLSGRVLVGGSAAVRSTPGAYGLFAPGDQHAIAISRHMQKYGTTRSQLSAISVAQRWYANQRPDAYMHDRPLTIEDCNTARVICSPLRRFDYCLVTDGGVAFIITTMERAKDLRKPPVPILGWGAGSNIKQSYDNLQFDGLSIQPARDTALRMAGVELKDIDVAELYDCFTPTVLFETEGYGWCKPGEGGPFYEGKNTLPKEAGGTGLIPINTGGGEMSGWYCEGYTAVTEGIKQMRGEGGATQVKDAELALCAGHGWSGGGPMTFQHATLILGKS